MDSTGNPGPNSKVGWILVALVVGLIAGYFASPSKSKKPNFVGGDPCGTSNATSHEIDFNDASQPCYELDLDSTKSETVVWSAPNQFHPYVVFKDPGIPTPVVSGNTATWMHPAGPPGQPTAAYVVNIVPTTTKLPLPPNPPGQPTPTPGMYGRIIIKP